MILAGRPAKILLIDTNVYFSKRLSDALKREGFEVTCSTQPAFALTTLEYDAPGAIVCSTNMREMGALDIARLVRADAKNSAMPIIALGDGGQRALMEAFQAGCDDYIDRTRPPAVIATHVRNIIVSKTDGFQPTQMLAQSDTSLSGSLTHHDLPGVMQMLGHAHQTGALHINSGDTDALLFFDAGEISHAECASLFGDEAVIHILKSCMRNNSGVYKFVYGSASPQRTVLRSATDLMLDAMRELDESAHSASEVQPSDISTPAPKQAAPPLAPSPQPDEIAPAFAPSEIPTDTVSPEDRTVEDFTAEDDNAAIAAILDNFAAKTSDHSNQSFGSTDFNLCGNEPETGQLEAQPENANISTEPEPARPEEVPQPLPPSAQQNESQIPSEPSQPAEEAPLASNPEAPETQLSSELSPFANYSLIPYAGDDNEDIS